MADLVIRGMEMPTRCGLCPMFCDDFNDYCSAAQRSIPFDAEKPEWCPLLPLPEGHGRLGDLDALDRAFTSLRFNADGHLAHWDDRRNWCLHGYEIEQLIGEAPIIVPAE